MADVFGEKSSSNLILSAYKFDDIKDVNLKYLMVVGYTQAVSLVVKANNEGLKDYPVGAALSATLQCVNIIQSQTPPKHTTSKFDTYRKKLTIYYDKLHGNGLEELDKSKAMLYCQEIHREMSRKLSQLIHGMSFEHPESAMI
jgi:hypothetical protein